MKCSLYPFQGILACAVVFWCTASAAEEARDESSESRSADAASLFRAHFAQTRSWDRYDVIIDVDRMTEKPGTGTVFENRRQRLVRNDSDQFALIVSRIAYSYADDRDSTTIYSYGLLDRGKATVRQFPNVAMRSDGVSVSGDDVLAVIRAPCFPLLGTTPFGMVDMGGESALASLKIRLLSTQSPRSVFTSRSTERVTVKFTPNLGPGSKSESRSFFFFDPNHAVLLGKRSEARRAEPGAEWQTRRRERIQWDRVHGSWLPIKIDGLENKIVAGSKTGEVKTYNATLNWKSFGEPDVLRQITPNDLNRIELLEKFVKDQ